MEFESHWLADRIRDLLLVIDTYSERVGSSRFAAVDNKGQTSTDREIKEQRLTFLFAPSDPAGHRRLGRSPSLMIRGKVGHACEE